jgi:hypothetical protein
MNNIDAINRAAEQYEMLPHIITYGMAFREGALSDVTKQYWYEVFKKEFKILDDEPKRENI